MPSLTLRSKRSAQTDYMVVIDGSVTSTDLNPEDSVIRQSGGEDIVSGLLEGGTDSINYTGEIVDFKAEGATINILVDGSTVSGISLQANSKERPVSGPVATNLNVETSLGSLTAKVSWFNPHPHELFFSGGVSVTGKGLKAEMPDGVGLMGARETVTETVSFSFDGILTKK